MTATRIEVCFKAYGANGREESDLFGTADSEREAQTMAENFRASVASGETKFLDGTAIESLSVWFEKAS